MTCRNPRDLGLRVVIVADSLRQHDRHPGRLYEANLFSPKTRLAYLVTESIDEITWDLPSETSTKTRSVPPIKLCRRFLVVSQRYVSCVLHCEQPPACRDLIAIIVSTGWKHQTSATCTANSRYTGPPLIASLGTNNGFTDSLAFAHALFTESRSVEKPRTTPSAISAHCPIYPPTFMILCKHYDHGGFKQRRARATYSLLSPGIIT